MSVQFLKMKGLLKRYTGIKPDSFDSLVIALNVFQELRPDLKLPKTEPLEEMLLLCLIKLRCNFTFDHLGLLFSCSRKKTSKIFYNILETLDIVLGSTVTTVPGPADCRIIQPSAFKHSLTNLITLCVDCTDFKIVCPRKNLSVGRTCYSEYRGGYTLKALIAILPSGAIAFCSDLFGGRISDKEICKQSGFFKQLTHGHVLAVDKGFKIREDVPAGVDIAIPSFKVKGEQFTTQQAIRSRTISSARSHVERVNERIKNYAITCNMHYTMRSVASRLLRVVCCLVNFESCIISENNEALEKLK